MKETILKAALAQFGSAACLGIGLLVFGTSDIEFAAKLYGVCTILGATGVCTGIVGAVYPKGETSGT